MSARKKAQATWGGRFSAGPAELMLRFGESVSFDRRLWAQDIRGSKAHATMLSHVGILTARECAAIVKGLDAIAKEIAAGKFVWSEALEDVHMNIESALTKRVPAAAKLHTARSRNDQVATDVRLWIKDQAAAVDASLVGLLRALVELAAANATVILPGYTHLQRAQPVSAAHHLLAYAEMFGRDRTRFAAAAASANWCPLGSGAIAGTTLPIRREITAKLLGFVDAKGRPQVTTNSMDAVADRDSATEFCFAAALCGVHLSRLAEDMILWSTAEFGFARLPDEFSTGSSLMPQKRNPDSMELLRGKAARFQASLTHLLTLTKGLPLTYNRDLQDDKPPLFDAADQILLSLDVAAATLRGTTFNRARCLAAASDPALLATDLADWLVLKGMPFRHAHHAVGRLVALAEKSGVPLDKLSDVAALTADAAFTKGWREVFSLQRGFAARENTGMPGPKAVARELARWQKALR
ncbi:MAG: argininosuccinate lyase [Opitutales bacterium]|nr:argininosuccinate lyase [Opitutales bacterium]